MEDPRKLAILWVRKTQDEESKHTTQYVLDYTTHKQAQIM